MRVICPQIGPLGYLQEWRSRRWIVPGGLASVRNKRRGGARSRLIWVKVSPELPATIHRDISCCCVLELRIAPAVPSVAREAGSERAGTRRLHAQGALGKGTKGSRCACVSSSMTLFLSGAVAVAVSVFVGEACYFGAGGLRRSTRELEVRELPVPPCVRR